MLKYVLIIIQTVTGKWNKQLNKRYMRNIYIYGLDVTKAVHPAQTRRFIGSFEKVVGINIFITGNL